MYARMLDSTMSVEMPRPEYTLPSAISFTTDSPMASRPSVTAWMLKSSSS